MMQRDRRRHVGQLMLAGFRGHSIPVELRSLARDFDLGGVVLFARNVAEPAQVAELAREAAELSRSAPVWVAIDQEGGRVQRVKAPLTIWPAAAALGRADDLDLTRRFARALARELRAMGITFDFAPVLDVLTRKDNPAIGDRSLSERSGRGRAPWRDADARPCSRKGCRPAPSISRDTGTRRSIHTRTCRSSTSRPIGWSTWNGSRSVPPSTQASMP